MSAMFATFYLMTLFDFQNLEKADRGIFETVTSAITRIYTA
jgi:hypothetical protein